MENTRIITKKCMETDRKIQILLSTYNGEKYLREQLDSYLKLEGFENIKVLIRDDGSTDSTPDILDEYHQNCGFEIVKGQNLGVNRSMFELFRLSDKTCDYFALSDQDDVWLPCKFKIALDKLEQYDSNLPLLFASCSQVVTKDLKPLGSTLIPKKGVGFFNAMVQNVTPGHTQVFNLALMQQLIENYTKNILVMDWWIYLVASGIGKVVFTNQFTVLHRQHGDNAVGYELNKRKNFLHRIKRIRSDQANAISIQLQAFFNCYQSKIKQENKEEVDRYFIYQKSFISRFFYVLKCRTYRQTGLETIAFKVLYLFGKYNL
ncbi:glycosyltransferase [Caproiciproducens galactitolivorans]|uniref:Glycosyltransferase n=1 Tax=Caproiciproducens galactitolivorans TaxID=642589 RepID=A0ABT4BRS0_9FIRM|nr:glycosyltransferase [Caproiciproducens galactitolivorans]MCY1713490.1 glycosyltransferase [Caproiciproducens galactitolivorans]